MQIVLKNPGYSEASKNKPQITLVTPMKPMASNAMKLNEDEKTLTPAIINTEKVVDKAPENINRAIWYLQFESKISKTLKRSSIVVSLSKLSTSIVEESKATEHFLRLRRIQNKNMWVSD